MTRHESQPERADASAWWGERRLAENRCGHFHLGGFRMWLLNMPREWHLAWETEPVEEPGDVGWDEADAKAFPEGGEPAERYMLRNRTEVVTLAPRLPDRPVVSSPRMPVYLLPEEETTLFIGVPLWVVVSVGESPQELREFPLSRTHDTWFGDNTLSGELCYDVKTRARVERENLPRILLQAISPVRVENLASTPLRIEQIKLPAPYLELYATDTSSLWTQALTLRRESDGNLARVEMEPGPPRGQRAETLVTPPRSRVEGVRFLARAFSSILEHGDADE